MENPFKVGEKIPWDYNEFVTSLGEATWDYYMHERKLVSSDADSKWLFEMYQEFIQPSEITG